MRAFELAKNGLGMTYPNPMVGCVVVCDDRIIGEGWHRKAGGPHAEVNAINSVREKHLLPKSDVYVSLEPCSHFGKTPPCSDLLIAKKVKRVIVGGIDPFDKVKGKGIKRLESAGVEVVKLFMPAEAFDVNKRFFTYHLLKRPYVFLKFAESADGFMDIKRNIQDLESAQVNWISNPYSKQVAHKLRANEAAILVGKNTVKNDNPALSTRLWFGDNPLRVLVDRELSLNSRLKILNDGIPTLILTSDLQKGSLHLKDFIDYARLDRDGSLVNQILNELYRRGVQSLIVEGGAQVLQQFIDTNLWDELFRFQGQRVFGQGVYSPKFEGNDFFEVFLGEDKFSKFYPNSRMAYNTYLKTQE